MAVELWLVRHGQAAFATDDYDRLTDLGWSQAGWLAKHLAAQRLAFDVVAAGRLRRQQETASALAAHLGEDVRTIEGLEEYDADAILNAYGAPAAPAEDRRAHFRRLRAALAAWSKGEAPLRPTSTLEPWAAFDDRVRKALAAAVALSEAASRTTERRRALIATSGGVVGLAVAQALGLAPTGFIELNLQARNTGVTRLVSSRGALYLNMFNAVPHLERADRRDAETYS